MNGFILKKAGSADDLIYTDLTIPVLENNQVLIRTKTISINPIDIKSRSDENTLSWLFGDKRPVILGWDVLGTVTEIGKEVKSLKVGDKVFGMVNFPGTGNTYAEYVAAPESQLAIVPEGVAEHNAVAATLAALTAWQVLHKGGVKKGSRVLIHAASGGVGHYAVQMAKYLGAYVIGTSSSANKDFVLNIGADEHIDYRSQKFEEIVKDLDFVFDTIGGETLSKSIETVKKGGKIITIAGQIPQSEKDKASASSVEIEVSIVESNGKDMQTIADLLKNGSIKSHIYKTFLFENMIDAQKELEKHRTVGKIVVDVE